MVRGASRTATRATAAGTAAAIIALVAIGGCGGSSGAGTTDTPASSPQATTTSPGTGKPLVTIGDKNTTEQFVLGELYYQALAAKGFKVMLNRNIGPTEVTLKALQSGRLAMYPEYLQTWNTAVAGYRHGFKTAAKAYQAAQHYALAHGLELLNPTRFSNTDAIGVTAQYALEHRLLTVRDLQKVAPTLTLGAPPQFQQGPNGLPQLEQAYGFAPATFKPLDLGSQYQALTQGTVQAADVNTTDGELTSGDYRLLKDPHHALGWGNVVPVASPRLLDVEGPVFAATIDKVSSLLTLGAMRRLNAAVEVSHQDPDAVARKFLIAHGLIKPSDGGG
jgi:osmoprotectant transport system substrate-binding protein